MLWFVVVVVAIAVGVVKSCEDGTLKGTEDTCISLITSSLKIQSKIHLFIFSR